MSNTQHLALTAEREEFRNRFNVRIIDEKEEGLPIRRLPAGVYGFTTSPATDEIPVFIKPVYQCVELMKDAGGDVHFVGYLTEAEKAIYEKGAEPFSADFYPEPYEDHTALVAIHAGRIDRRKPPTRDHGNPMRIDVGPDR